MTFDDVVVVPTGTANTASVMAALERANARPRLTDNARATREADYVVLPGVGAFAAAMRRLASNGMGEAVRERIERRRPLLAICLGLQLLATASDESPDTEGLAVWPLRVRALDRGVRVPQLGWNAVLPDEDCRMLAPGHAYFANSYALTEAPRGWSVSFTTYGRSLIAAVESGPVLACQFHPELSGDWGAQLIRRWLEEGQSC